MTSLLLHRMPQGMHGATGRIVAQFSNRKRITLERLAEDISASCTLTKADVVGCVMALAEVVAHYTSQGCSVALGDLGTFSASLKVDTASTPHTTDAVRVTKVEVSRVCFRASPYLRRRMAERVERIVPKARRIVPKAPPTSSTEDRLALVQAYLRKYHVISVRQYAALAGISHYRAATELRHWRTQTAITGIGTAGCGTHRMAVWEGEGGEL